MKMLASCAGLRSRVFSHCILCGIAHNAIRAQQQFLATAWHALPREFQVGPPRPHPPLPPQARIVFICRPGPAGLLSGLPSSLAAAAVMAFALCPLLGASTSKPRGLACSSWRSQHLGKLAKPGPALPQVCSRQVVVQVSTPF